MENIFVLIFLNLFRALWFWRLRNNDELVTIGSIAAKPAVGAEAETAALMAEAPSAPPEPESLCSGCTWGQFIRGRNGEITAVCRYSAAWIYIAFPVAECNYFRPSVGGSESPGFAKRGGIAVAEEDELLPLGSV